MVTLLLEPRNAPNKAFLKIKPNRTRIEDCKTDIIQFLDSITKKKSEVFLKSLATVKVFFICFLFCLPLLLSSCSNSDNNSGIISSDPNCNQIVNIPDANFKAKLLSATGSGNNAVASNLAGFVCIIDTNGDGIIQVCEAENISSLTVDNSNITSMEGLLSFRNLKSISCRNNQITTLDLSSLKQLQNVVCDNNNLNTLNVQGLNNLKVLWCYRNQLTSLNLSSLPSLESLYFEFNKISTLNISSSNAINDLRGRYNLLTTLTVSHLKNLNQLYISDNLLKSLDVKDLANLTSLQCTSNNMTTLNTSNCVNLMDISCDQNALTTINLSNCSKLNYLRCNNNKLITINLNGLAALQNLDLSNNLLSSLDIRYCPLLVYLSINVNNLQTLVLKNGSNLNDYYFGINPNLSSICCDPSELTQVQNQVNFFGYNCVVSTNCF